MDKRELNSILVERDDSLNKSIIFQSLENIDASLHKKIRDVIEHPRPDILNDQPASEDTLGITSLVKTLSDIVLSKNTQTPVTICVNGKWGTGKTSVLKMIERNAKILNVPCLWLNAWSLETADNLITSIGSEVQREYTQEKDSNYNKMLNFLELLGNIADSIGSTLSMDLIGKITGTIQGGIVKASRKREIEQLASIATAHTSFAKIIDLLLAESNADRVIIFVDDLDRALPDQIADILKNLKLILEVRNCIFVLAMDKEIVANAIEVFYKRSAQQITFGSETSIEVRGENNQVQFGFGIPFYKGFGDSYLEKLIQLSVDVPSMTKEKCMEFLDCLSIAPEVKEIVYWAPEIDTLNPRSLKRYINWLSISLQLIIASKLPDDLGSLNVLRMIALRRDYPEIYHFLLSTYRQSSEQKSVSINISRETLRICENSEPSHKNNVALLSLEQILREIAYDDLLHRKKYSELYNFIKKQERLGKTLGNVSDLQDRYLLAIEFLESDPSAVLKYELPVFTSDITPAFNVFVAETLSKTKVPLNHFLSYLKNNIYYHDIGNFENFVAQNPLFQVKQKV